MSARFVRIPFGDRLRYPGVCPFTGVKNPRSAVLITRHETQMWLPIPFLGQFRLSKTGRMIFPATRRIAIVARALALLPWLALFSGLVSLIWVADRPDAWLFVVGGFVMMYVFFGLDWLWLRRVRIVRIGMSSLEVRFAFEEYAEEFCAMNELSCRTKATPKRATPITVNDVR